MLSTTEEALMDIGPDNGRVAELKRRTAGLAAVAVLSFSAGFATCPVSFADPYDDDGGSFSSEESSGGDTTVDQTDSGVEEPSFGGGEVEDPSLGGGEVDQEPGGGFEPDEQPAGADDNTGDPNPGGGSHGGPPTGSGNAVETPIELHAPAEDIAAAMHSDITSETSTEVTSSELTSYSESVESIYSSSTSGSGLTLTSPVARWNSRWTSYDRYYRPVFTNPYRTELQVIYEYAGQPRIFTVPPLQRTALDVPEAGVYSFTAMTRPESGPVANVAVGSFSGGGYQPAPGQAPPKKPAALKVLKNPLVQVKFDRGSSDVFRVASLTDLGPDATNDGRTKVLIDGEIPAWGQWTKDTKGEALFVISQTQLLPGLKPPGEQPLPGYTVSLTAAPASQSWFSGHKGILIGAGAGALVLVAAGVLASRRRRPDQGA